MKRKPIYVEIDINTDMNTLWDYTQRPELHEQWDLRFTEIHYLPREKEDVEQHFHYVTRIGFGMAIAGTGVSKAAVRPAGGEQVSALTFSSDQAISLIKKGRGYWKYTPQDAGITFVTQFDYEIRFGLLGKCIDRFLFRPLFGLATAWSFDALRIWLEKGIQPALSIQRAITHYFSVLMISLLWIYQGLVPKLLFPEAGELTIIQEIGWFQGWESELIRFLGMTEISIGLLTVVWHRRKWIYLPQVIFLAILACIALIGNAELLKEPFNPLTLSVSMIGFCLLAQLSTRELPQAKRCLRKRGSTKWDQSTNKH